MKQEIITGSVGTGISFIGTVIQTNELLQTYYKLKEKNCG